MTYRCRRLAMAALGATLILLSRVAPVAAHLSFAMYDQKKTYVLTGVVTRISPDPNHLTIFFGVLDESRTAVLRDGQGEPVIWSVELRASNQVARDGVTGANFPPGQHRAPHLRQAARGRAA